MAKKDDAGQRALIRSPSASNKSSVRSATSSGGSQPTGSDGSPTPSGNEDFKQALLARLERLEGTAQLAKILILEPGNEKHELKLFLIVKDQWRGKSPDVIRVVRFHGFITDQVIVKNHPNTSALGVFIDLAISQIGGFQWAKKETASTFFDLERYDEPN